jgi:hypothetical protein
VEALPESNARHLGLDETEVEYDEGNWEMVTDDANRSRRVPGAMGLLPEQDVRQGGYPTFSGGRMTDPGSQVPTGVLEQGSDGRAMSVMREDGDGVGRPHQATPRRPRRKASPPMIEVPGRYQQAMTRPLPAVGEDALGSAQLEKLPHAADLDIARPLAGRPASSMPLGQSELHRSTSLSTTDLAPRFPLPPSRANTKIAHRESVVAAKLPEPPEGMLPREALSPRRSVVSSAITQFPAPPKRPGTTHRSPTTPHLRVTPNTPGESPLTPHLNAQAQRATVVRLPMAQARPWSSLSTRAKSRGEQAQSPPLHSNLRAPTSSEEQTATMTVPASKISPLHRSASARAAHQPIRASVQTPIRPALSVTVDPAPAMILPALKNSTLHRSASSLTAVSSRKDRGVRFDLGPVPEDSQDSQPEAAHSLASLTSPPRTGLRIPGTSFHLPIPSFPSTPRPPRRASMSSLEDEARPESFISTSSDRSGSSTWEQSSLKYLSRETRGSVSDEKAGLPPRPKTVMVLGGAYLSGGSEVEDRQRGV